MSRSDRERATPQAHELAAFMRRAMSLPCICFDQQLEKLVRTIEIEKQLELDFKSPHVCPECGRRNYHLVSCSIGRSKP